MVSQNNFENVFYKKNFLREVIARVDLVSPIISLIKELPKDISSTALKQFPIEEPKKGFTQEVLFGPNELATKKEEFIEWNFYGRNREKLLRIFPKHFLISYYEYEKYENLRDDFLSLVDSFFSCFDEAQPSRFGLRYINQIDISNGDPLDWQEYINSDLLGLFNYSVKNAKPSRIFHTYEVDYKEKYSLRFNYGLDNPDYPSAIRRKIFILDYDAFYKGLISQEDISIYMDLYHESIQNMFERNITNKLRKVLNEQ